MTCILDALHELWIHNIQVCIHQKKKQANKQKTANKQKKQQQQQQQQQQKTTTIARQMNHQNCYNDKKYKPVQSRSIPTPDEAAMVAGRAVCTKMYVNCPYSKGLDAVCQEFNILAHTLTHIIQQMQQVNGKETFSLCTT